MPRALSRLLKQPFRPATLAVVDLGSNSFRLEVGRVEGDQIFRLDTWRETIRFGAGIDEKGNLTAQARRAALACLTRFRERLSGLHPSAVRAVATNTFRIARNAAEFLPQAEAALGFPIDIIGGHEEARLIYLGVAHVLPASGKPRLVIDIGGGSTEFIIGRDMTPERLESLKLGCVSMSARFFGDGSLRADAFAAAETHARAEIEAIARAFGREHWHEAFASSGTALALAAILEENGLSAGGITPDGLARLRKRMIGAGRMSRLQLAGVKPERAPVLAGGFAIMAAAIAELDVPRINPVGGALRLGVLYDLLGRTVKRDSRAVTVGSMLERYHIDRPHAARVAAMAKDALPQGVARARSRDRAARRMGGPAARDRLHRVAPRRSTSTARTSSRTPTCRDSPRRTSAISRCSCWAAAAACRRWPTCSPTATSSRRSSRCGSPCCSTTRAARSTRRASRSKCARTIRFGIAKRWLAAHPLTSHLLDVEREEWADLGFPWRAPVRGR